MTYTPDPSARKNEFDEQVDSEGKERLAKVERNLYGLTKRMLAKCVPTLPDGSIDWPNVNWAALDGVVDVLGVASTGRVPYPPRRSTDERTSVRRRDRDSESRRGSVDESTLDPDAIVAAARSTGRNGEFAGRSPRPRRQPESLLEQLERAPVSPHDEEEAEPEQQTITTPVDPGSTPIPPAGTPTTTTTTTTTTPPTPSPARRAAQRAVTRREPRHRPHHTGS